MTKKSEALETTDLAGVAAELASRYLNGFCVICRAEVGQEAIVCPHCGRKCKSALRGLVAKLIGV
jgi:predicted amidophosphoribosyltransferase